MPGFRLGEALPRLVERVVGSYFADPRTQFLDREHLPGQRQVERIVALLLELTYPGFFGRQRLTQHNISFHVGELLPQLWELLQEEIFNCVCHRDEVRTEPGAAEACPKKSAKLATRFVERLPETRALLAEDVQAHYDGDPAAVGTSEVLLAYPGMLAITIYRHAHELHRLHVPFLPRMMTELAHARTGIDIHPGASIGRSFCIDHGTGVVVGETTEIGNHVKLYQGVTLGALSFAKDDGGALIRGHKRHPTLGNHVTIYSNATVLGGDTVLGDGSVVGGGVFLTRSVAPGQQVSLAPPILRVRSQSDKRRRADGEFVPDWAI